MPGSYRSTPPRTLLRLRSHPATALTSLLCRIRRYKPFAQLKGTAIPATDLPCCHASARPPAMPPWGTLTSACPPLHSYAPFCQHSAPVAPAMPLSSLTVRPLHGPGAVHFSRLATPQVLSATPPRLPPPPPLPVLPLTPPTVFQPSRQLSALPMSCATKTALGADPVALRGKIALGTVSVARGSLRFLTDLPFLGLWAPILCLKSRQIIACPVTYNGTKR